MSKNKTGFHKTLNPPFDPRVLSIGSPTQAKGLARGRLVMATPHSVTGMKHALQFLYNPISVDVTHNFSTPMLGGSDLQVDPQGQMGQAVNLGTVSVDLLFDRTYECWDSGKKNTPAGKYGMYADVLALYQMTNIAPISIRETYGSMYGFGDAEVWQTLYPSQAPDTSIQYYLYIGNKLKFYGYLNGIEITYSHFTRKMIPSRGVINIGINFGSDNSSQGPTGTTGSRKKVNTHGIHMGPKGPMYNPHQPWTGT